RAGWGGWTADGREKRVGSPGDGTRFCLGIGPALAKRRLERGTPDLGFACISAWPGHPAGTSPPGRNKISPGRKCVRENWVGSASCNCFVPLCYFHELEIGHMGSKQRINPISLSHRSYQNRVLTLTRKAWGGGCTNREPASAGGTTFSNRDNNSVRAFRLGGP